MAEPVVGIGAGGHAKGVIEILRAAGGFDLVGLLEIDPELIGSTVLGVPILGDDDMLPHLKEQGVRHFFVGVGSVGDTSNRIRIYEMALALDMEPVVAIHPSAIISRSAEIGKGITVMAGVIVNACVRLGDNVILNTGAILDHDCCIGNHVHVATGARLSGAVRVGAGAHIGAGAVVRQNLTIGRGAIVGVGAAVVRDVEANETVAGVPARRLQRQV